VAKIGSAIADSDVIISMNHFKGHEMTGFGGALKNLGMGCASVGGKLFSIPDRHLRYLKRIVQDAGYVRILCPRCRSSW